MTPEQLVTAPVGTIVKLNGDAGEIIRAGAVIHIMWPEARCTTIIDTNSKAWQTFIGELETE